MVNLKVVNITKSFGKTKVLKDVSFEVHKGEFVVLLGPSGCGKTTMLRIIAGLEAQDSGEIHIDGREVSGLSPKDRDVAMVFQSYALYPHMSVYDNMAFPLKMRKTPKEQIDRKVREVARLLNIEELLDRKPRQLSGGQRQRVAIGRAIVREPKLFLFDEPLSNLDAQLRASMRVELRQLHRRLQGTSLYVTHDQTEAMTLADRIILLKDGQVQQIGTPGEVYRRPANLFVATFIGTPQINLLEGRIQASEGRLYFVTEALRIPIERPIPQNISVHKVVLGIRPEGIVIEGGPFRAEVEHIEFLGSENILYLNLQGHKLVAKTSERPPTFTLSNITIGFVPEAMHLFYEGRLLG